MGIQGPQGPEDSPGEERSTLGREAGNADRRASGGAGGAGTAFGGADTASGGEGGAGAEPSGGVYEWYTRGLELLGAGSPAAAVQLLQRAAEAEPSSRSIREALARAQYGSRRFADAADSFRWIVEDNPSEDYALFGLGLSLSRLGDFEEAVEHLALAVAMRPENKHYTNALRHVRATLAARR
ncbi:Tetratricopeptide repeat-containing protein [Thermomonospora echinospora]|uniref:Tetratricopeptide repeat-containing protein n=1 Tax=Thermomonospora echinospora TaxID=1992 RepID=A0A1H6BUE7_9ACTN|nr:tetratricopeptide repeat protein [Thermomonospora echinospora]SEG64252.1 Tetratricopeptide repeat-containing protein [Thermomonospora echinospora]